MVLGSLFSLPSQNRSETAFLPVVTFGYIYVKSEQLPLCAVSMYLDVFSLPRYVLLMAAVISAIFSAFVFVHDPPRPPSELREILSFPILAGIFQLLFFIWSFLELLLRVCSYDAVIVGLLLAHFSLYMISVFE